MFSLYIKNIRLSRSFIRLFSRCFCKHAINILNRVFPQVHQNHFLTDLLDAAEGQNTADWNLLRGKVYMEQGKFREAVRCLHLAEQENPKETAPLLERCYRELEEYKRAYEYACKQK